MRIKREGAPVLAGTARFGVPTSSRVPGVEGGWRLQLAVFRHHVGRRLLLAAPAEPGLRDVILARPALLAALAYPCLLANAQTHNLSPWCSRPSLLYLANVLTDSAPDDKSTVARRRRLCSAIPCLDIAQCRVPPSPPAIRDMEKPRLR
jgi:hypothetical protein